LNCYSVTDEKPGQSRAFNLVRQSMRPTTTAVTLTLVVAAPGTLSATFHCACWQIFLRDPNIELNFKSKNETVE
jgi:hypothetical protein